MIIDGWVNLTRLVVEHGELSPELGAVSSFFGHGADVWQEQTADDLIAVLDHAGVDRAVLHAELPLLRSGMELPTCFLDKALEAAKKHERLRVAATLPGVRDIAGANRLLRELSADGLVIAAAVTAAALEVELTDRRLYGTYAVLEELRLPLICNLGIFGPPKASKYQHPIFVEEICSDFPNLVVIGAHMGHPWERLLVRLMMKFPNLYLMTSAYLPKYLDQAILEFMVSSRGRGKLMFGSDYPVLDPARCLTEADKLGLPEEVLIGYLGGNLSSVLRWP